MPSSSQTNKKPSPLAPVILVLCTWVSVLSTDMYLPSLPYLPDILGTTDRAVKWTLSFNLAAYALAQLFLGPMSDRFGRRAVLLITFSLFSLASILSAMSTSIEMLLVSRFLQGCLSSAPSVLVALMIYELYERGQAVRIMGFHGLAVGLAPMVGPVIGGYVFLAFGWQANFWLIAAFALIVAAFVALWVPETLSTARTVSVIHIAQAYREVLSNRYACGFILAMACTFGVLFAFLTNVPFILANMYDLPTEHIGYHLGAIFVAYVLGGAIASRIGGRVNTFGLALTGYAIIAAGAFAFGLLALAGQIPVVALTGAIAVFSIGMGLQNAAAPVLIFEATPANVRSVASAVTGSAQLGMGSFSSFLVSGISPDPLNGTAIVAVGLGVIGLSGFLFNRRRR